MENTNNVRPIKSIRFYSMTKSDIIDGAAIEVTHHETYSNGQPVPHGLFDPHMGVIEPGVKCKTCKQGYVDCPGHFGYLKLASPIYNIIFMKTLIKFLKCICPNCSKLLVDPSEITSKKSVNKKRFEEVYKLCSKKKRCSREDGCQMELQKIVSDGPLNISVEVAGVNEKIHWTPTDVLRILKRVTDEDTKLLGFDPRFFRPECMIMEVLLVSPPSVRPSVRSDSNSRQEDDLTRKLMSIIKNNKSLKDTIDKKNKNSDPNLAKHLEERVQNGVNSLQWDVATMIDNSNRSIPEAKEKASDNPSKSLTDRLKGKDGRIRGNLMGKRVDFSSRSVITPDPYIKIDELGVPLVIAMNLTVPEIVNQYNIEELRRLVMAGAQKYPGAKTVVKKDTQHTFLLYSNNPVCQIQASKLNYGDVVNRFLRNGDPVLFNRQPSLHRMSMMCHKVVVMPGNTFRLNVCVTAPYNADFDGDEMNAHVPQSYQTAEELNHLANVSTQIISPRECEPIIAVVQDVCTGLYLITKSDVTISPKNAMNLLALNPNIHKVDWKKLGSTDKPWSGRQVISTLFPDKINLHTKTRDYDTSKSAVDFENRDVVIEKGVLKRGAVTKEIYQKQTLGVVQQIFNEYGDQSAKQLFDNTQPLICKWLESNGFSVGVKDIILSPETRGRFFESTQKMLEQVQEVIVQVEEGRFENKSAKTNLEYFEETVNNILNKAVSHIGSEALKEVDSSNSFIEMCLSGGKGSTRNVAQITACVGQQNVSGKRIPYGFNDRTLPHFTKFDDGPESRGFVQSSFSSGLNPQEFFFSAMGGREGLIGSKVTTSQTGYIQRRLIKFMEDCVVEMDYSVRDRTGRIVQFLYGNDAMNATKLEKQTLPTINMNMIEIFNEYQGGDEKLTDYARQVIEDKRYAINYIFDGQPKNKVIYPVAFERLIGIYTNIRGDGKLTTAHVLKALEDLDQTVFVTPAQKGNQMFIILARAHLNPRRLTNIMSKTSFDQMIETIKERFEESLITPGEMVGITAAESIGEPSTQLVLNTFHSSGMSAASRAVKGIPRLNEILGAATKIKTPVMRIKFADEVKQDPIKMEEIMNGIRIVKLRNVVVSWRIFYDPYESEILQDTEFVDIRRQIVPLESQVSPWLLRIELDREKMLEYRLSTTDIQTSLKNFYNDKFDIMINDGNSKEIIIRIRIKTFSADADMLTDLKAAKEVLMEDFVIKGVKNIRHSTLDKEEKFVRFDQNSLDFEESMQRFVYTDGSNLMDIMGMEGVDPSQVTSNDIMEVYNTLGIEAARKLMHAEILSVLDEIYVNDRHISLLIDMMTNNGLILSTNRFGVGKGDASVLAKSSFEENASHLIKAAMFSEVDQMKGVSANVMLGQITPMGTGMVNVYQTDVAAPQTKNRLPKIREEDTSNSNSDRVMDMLKDDDGMDFDI